MIYVLRLEEGKYYVGYSERLEDRGFSHSFNRKGTKWTQIYKPISLMDLREGTLEDEDKVTIEYMSKYFWQNVRGGKWTQVEMSMPPKELLDYLLKNKKACSKCGRTNHSVETCRAKTSLGEYKIKSSDNNSNVTHNNNDSSPSV